MIDTMKNIVGGGDFWAPNADGTVQYIDVVADQEQVVFTGVPYDPAYGYELYSDPETIKASPAASSTPSQIGDPTFGTITNGKRTVTYNITKTALNQVGSRFMLRILR